MKSVADGAASYISNEGNLIFAEVMKRIEVFAANGMTVATATNASQIDLKGLEAGLYIVRTENAAGQLLTVKIMANR